MSVMEWVKRTNLANVTAVVVTLAGLGYAIYSENSELAAFIIGASVTWLFDQKNTPNGV
jgi:hypothetical protein